MAVGADFAVLIRSDGEAICSGSFYDTDGREQSIPALDDGVRYTQVAAHGDHFVLFRSDGTVVALGTNAEGQLNLPELDEGVTYTRGDVSLCHTVLIRSDGKAIACGNNWHGQCNIPELKDDLIYTQVAAGGLQTILIRSDGAAVACGNNHDGQCNIPPLDEGVKYTHVSSNDHTTVLLRSDGTAIACGYNQHKQCDLPAEEDVRYTQVATGGPNTLLLRSDGSVDSCGCNFFGQSFIPVLPDGVIYTQIAAGCLHTVLIRSDGAAVACGHIGSWGRRGLGPALALFQNDGTPINLPYDLAYRYDVELIDTNQGDFFAWLAQPDYIVQLTLGPRRNDGGARATCRNLHGDQLASWNVRGCDTSENVKLCIEEVLMTGSRKLGVVLVDGRLMSAQSTWRDLLFREVYV